MEKNFLGLDGLKNFWETAQTKIKEIIKSITKQDGITGATINRFGTCLTAAATAAKTVSITNGTFSLEAGARVSVKFSNANTADTPTLNVSDSGAKYIFHKGAQIATGENKALLAGVCDFIYDGTQWHLIGNYIDNDTTYSSLAAANGGTAVSLVTTGEKYIWNNKAAGTHTHTKSQITDFPTSLPANGGTASSCSGNSATATQLQTARTINIQDSSATYTGTGASFNGSGDATIKLPSIIKANEFKIGNGQQSIDYRSKSYNGYKMHEVQTNALYIEGRELDMGDSGGLAITNDSVTVFGAGDTNGVFRVVNEDNAGDGSATAPSIFNIFKDGKVTMTNRLTAPSATIGGRPAITGSYSDGILNLYTN